MGLHSGRKGLPGASFRKIESPVNRVSQCGRYQVGRRLVAGDNDRLPPGSSKPLQLVTATFVRVFTLWLPSA
ncbi:hypothetical protein CEXT_107141 [Caerostris extrusa]|uniref:Uncharacterized protein n=1 Tax=Caerostris extrusa TaxID=172846 RepID=A0AAV4YEA3_CAEEX|nr:hypothetical protein CEXT_107141 [Caerostris extrusa]